MHTGKQNEKLSEMVKRVEKDRSEGKVAPKITGRYIKYHPMPKEEFIEARKKLNLSQHEIAQVIGASVRAVQTYEQGIVEVPGPIARTMRLMKDNLIFRAIMLEDFMGDSSRITSFLKIAEKDIAVLRAKVKELNEVEVHFKKTMEMAQNDISQKAISLHV